MYAISLDAVPKPFSFVKAIITGFMQVEKLEYLSQRPAYKWYSGRDLNPHALRHQNLNLACLPISPPEQVEI